MALQISLMIKDLGASPLVFELSPIIAERYSIDISDDICDFCKKSDMILVGGGNLLAQKQTWPQGPFLNKVSKLTMAAEHWNKPIHAISIGGDGVLEAYYPYPVHRLLSSTCFKTALVRIKADLSSLSRYQINASFVPDILWTAAYYFKCEKDSSIAHFNVGVHFLSNAQWINNGLEKLRSQIRSLPHITLHFLNAFLDEPAGGDYLPYARNSNEVFFHGGDPVEVLKAISKLDFLISQGLHVGLIALSMKIPFFSMLAHPKVKAELSQINWKDCISYTGLKPRKYFGADWLTSQMMDKIKRCNNDNSVPTFYEASSVLNAYTEHIKRIIQNPCSTFL